MARKSDNSETAGRKLSRQGSAKPKISPNKIKGRKRAALELLGAGGRGQAGGRAFDFPNK